jgi:acetyl esterase
MSDVANTNLPGRLGSPNRLLCEDTRVDPRVPVALKPFGLDGEAGAASTNIDAPIEERLAFAAAAEKGSGALFSALAANLPVPVTVEDTTEIIKGVDGNDITLYIHRPIGNAKQMPGVLHIHGGAMAILTAASPIYTRWRQAIAETGLVVVGVEFRNSAGALGPHPFPAGLNDCTSALQWINDNKEKLGISKLIVSGDSGGGNLALATAMKSKQDGKIHQVDGVYAQCPYISNDYTSKAAGLASLTENDTYFINCQVLGILASLYDGADSRNPLAWPYYATAAALEGLPPHVISVTELDPLRDEGLIYYQKLLEVGVSAVSRTVKGSTHAGDVVLQGATPDIAAATIRDISNFANNL